MWISEGFFIQIFTVVPHEFNPHIPHSLTAALCPRAISAGGQIRHHSSSMPHDLPSRGRQGGSDGYTVPNLPIMLLAFIFERLLVLLLFFPTIHAWSV